MARFHGKDRIYVACFVVALCVVCLFVGPVHAQKTTNIEAPSVAYFPLIEDLPIMPGLVFLEDQSASFDKPSGRIILQAADLAGHDSASVLDYYGRLLPALGWTEVTRTKTSVEYTREAEHLAVTIEAQPSPARLVFLLSPIQ